MICEKRKENTFPECETEQNPHNPPFPQKFLSTIKPFSPLDYNLEWKKRQKETEKI